MYGFVNPAEVLSQLGLKENIIAADFGCGSGGWVIPLAKKLEDGKVFAVDIFDEPLSALRARMKMEKLTNIEAVKGNVENSNGSTLANDSCDLILMTNLLYQCEDKKAVLEEGKRVLRRKGMILIVDWARDNPLTTEIEHVSFEELKEISQELKLALVKEFNAGVYHHCLLLQKLV